MGVPATAFTSVVEDVALSDSARDAGGGESVADAASSEDAEVGEHG